ncbi:hypothetical protein K443DRAFT_684450 [Laccaria amethystina LaAM-08-1]|uniref:Uncharacterized protein n=1 Tax=Laccaria amethystina LaAM-08-1 TaxID=1095629 RepID=A0A0C9XBF3_9AGAR|nr:hypothetical protein K443DRAFT_684450 [Laccaria amethystina LaAM-08-1]
MNAPGYYFFMSIAVFFSSTSGTLEDARRNVSSSRTDWLMVPGPWSSQPLGHLYYYPVTTCTEA